MHVTQEISQKLPLRGVAMLCGLAMLAVPAAHAQAPTPSAPVPYPDARQQQQPQQQPQQQQYRQPRQQRQPNAQELRCMQLEQELANDWAHAQQGGDRLPRIDAEIRKYEDIYQSTQSRAENGGCYKSMFIFGRSLVRTPRCMKMHRQIEDARQRLTTLKEQRSAVSGGRGGQARKRELIDALARAGCGDQYQQETRRNSGGWFTSLFEEERSYRRPDLRTSRIESFATYRTLCVRTCDGYYFPVSYSALPSRFSQDISQCQNQCAAPAELFVYRNPGEEPEQMVSSDGRTAYNDLPNAWRYRKEYVKGCSCKPAEYDPSEIEIANRKAESDVAPGGLIPDEPGAPRAGAQGQPPPPQAQQQPLQQPRQQQ